VNPGEVWRWPDDTRRLVLSNATYNASGRNQVITAAVETKPPAGFDPLMVESPHGYVFPDRFAMHPRHWLVEPVARLDEEAYRQVREHLSFLLCLR
jgi:mRNA-degrading endonuclease toxin of MazEF toxin-antitoxin module